MCIRDSGSSVRGIETFERLSHDMGLHLMEVAPPARSVIQRSRVVGEGEDAVRVFELAGTIGFTGAERVVRRLSEGEPVEQTIVVDLTHVHSVGGPARHMLLEALRRLRLDGYTVYLIDHDEVLPDPDPGDGEVVEQLQEL